MITTGLPFLKFNIEIGGYANFLDETLPDFELEDGYLWIDESFELDDDEIYVCIDTDPEYYFYDAEEMEEYLEDYPQALLMDSEKIILKDDGEVVGMYYSDLGVDFSKDDLIGWVPAAYIITAIVMICIYIWDALMFFLGVVIVGLVGMIAASCMKCELTFGQLYMIGVYSRTLPLIIKAVLSFLPITIPGFFIINFGISVVILICAMQKMKEDKLQKPLEFHSGNDGNDFSWMK